DDQREGKRHPEAITHHRDVSFVHHAMSRVFIMSVVCGMRLVDSMVMHRVVGVMPPYHAHAWNCPIHSSFLPPFAACPLSALMMRDTVPLRKTDLWITL